MQEDLHRGQPHEHLNDTIIGFYLAFVLHWAPADKASSTATCSCWRSLDVVLDLCIIGNAMHAVRMQCEVLNVGQYSDPTFGPC